MIIVIMMIIMMTIVNLIIVVTMIVVILVIVIIVIIMTTNKQQRTNKGVTVPVDSTNRPLELFFTTVTRVRDSPCTRKMDKIAGVTAKSCKFT